MILNVQLDLKIGGVILGSFGSHRAYIGKYRHNAKLEMCKAAMLVYKRELMNTGYRDTEIWKVVVNEEDITEEFKAYKEEKENGWLPF